MIPFLFRANGEEAAKMVYYRVGIPHGNICHISARTHESEPVREKDDYLAASEALSAKLESPGPTGNRIPSVRKSAPPGSG